MQEDRSWVWTLQVQNDNSRTKLYGDVLISGDIFKKCVCFFLSQLLGLDRLDASNYTGVATERHSSVRGSDPVVGLWRTCD